MTGRPRSRRTGVKEWVRKNVYIGPNCRPKQTNLHSCREHVSAPGRASGLSDVKATPWAVTVCTSFSVNSDCIREKTICSLSQCLKHSVQGSPAFVPATPLTELCQSLDNLPSSLDPVKGGMSPPLSDEARVQESTLRGRDKYV